MLWGLASPVDAVSWPLPRPEPSCRPTASQKLKMREKRWPWIPHNNDCSTLKIMAIYCWLIVNYCKLLLVDCILLCFIAC